MFLINFAMLIFFAVGNIQAFASSTQLLTCTQDLGSFLSGCKLTQTEFAPKQSYEAALTLRYRFPCSGPAMEFYIQSPTSLAADSPINSQKLEYTSVVKEIPVTGYGPFVVLDLKPAKTSLRPFGKSCSVEVELVSIEASSGQKLKWQSDISSQQVLLASYKDNVAAYDALAILEPTYVIYGQLIDQAAGDFSNINQVVGAAQDLLSCSDGTQEDGCKTFIDKIVDGSLLLKFSDDEVKKLTKLQKTLYNADFGGAILCQVGDEGCTTLDKFLQKYLTADDIAKLTSAKTKLAAVQGSKENLEKYQLLVKQTEDSIKYLQDKISGSN